MTETQQRAALDWRELSTEERAAYPAEIAQQLRAAAIHDADDYPADWQLN